MSASLLYLDEGTVYFPENKGPTHCKAFFCGALSYDEDLYILLLIRQWPFEFAMNPHPFSYRTVSATASSGKALSFSSTFFLVPHRFLKHRFSICANTSTQTVKGALL